MRFILIYIVLKLSVLCFFIRWIASVIALITISTIILTRFNIRMHLTNFPTHIVLVFNYMLLFNYLGNIFKSFSCRKQRYVLVNYTTYFNRYFQFYMFRSYNTLISPHNLPITTMNIRSDILIRSIKSNKTLTTLCLNFPLKNWC